MVEQAGREVADSDLFIVKGPSLRDPKVTVNYALRQEDIDGYRTRSQLSLLAQLFTLVEDGLMHSRHCFNGLQRDLYCDGQQGSHQKFALARKPAYDYFWVGSRNSGRLVREFAPKDTVFVVVISENAHRDIYPDIEGWIDRWSWVAEDPGPLAETPTGWVDRYDSKIWTRASGAEA